MAIPVPSWEMATAYTSLPAGIDNTKPPPAVERALVKPGISLNRFLHVSGRPERRGNVARDER